MVRKMMSADDCPRESLDSMFNEHTLTLWERAKSKGAGLERTLQGQQKKTAERAYSIAEQQRLELSHMHNSATGARSPTKAAQAAAKASARRSARSSRRSSRSGRSTGRKSLELEGGRLSRDSAQSLRESARSNPSDSQLRDALLVLAAKKAGSQASSRAASDAGGSSVPAGADTWRKIYLQSRATDYAAEDEAVVYNGQNGGDSWRNYTTERGQTARISARAKEMLAAPVNAALGKNKLFFGRDETGDSEYLGEFDGGAKMARAQFMADSKGAPSPELARAAAEEAWQVVAGAKKKDAREALMQRLRSSSSLDYTFDPLARPSESQAYLDAAVKRRESAVARVKERDSTVLGINLNYPDDRSEEERRLADLKNKRSLMTKRDASSPRKLCTWEMEGVPGQQPYQPRPVGQVAANKTLIWGDGNSHVKLYTNPETARLAEAIIPVKDPPPPKEKPLTNAELGFYYEFKEGQAPVSEQDLMKSQALLGESVDKLRPLCAFASTLLSLRCVALMSLCDKLSSSWPGIRRLSCTSALCGLVWPCLKLSSWPGFCVPN